MDSLRKLRRKLLQKNYGVLAVVFLKFVAPMGTSTETLKMWHPSLIKIKNFSDLYAKLLIYILLFCIVTYAAITYVLTHITLNEILFSIVAWIHGIQDLAVQ